MKIDHADITEFCSILNGLLCSGDYTMPQDRDLPSALRYRQEWKEGGKWEISTHPAAINDALTLLRAAKSVLAESGEIPIMEKLETHRTSYFFDWLLSKWANDEKGLQAISVAELCKKYIDERHFLPNDEVSHGDRERQPDTHSTPKQP